MHQKSRTSNDVMKKLYIFNQLHTPTKVYKEIKFHNKISKKMGSVKKRKKIGMDLEQNNASTELQFALSRDV